MTGRKCRSLLSHMRRMWPSHQRIAKDRSACEASAHRGIGGDHRSDLWCSGFVRDWTIDTPLGRFGYAEIDYTLMIQVGPGPRKLHKVVFLGPLGEAPPVIGFGAVSALVSVYSCSRSVFGHRSMKTTNNS